MTIAFVALAMLIIPLGLLAATVWLWVRVVRGFTSANRDSAVCGACGAGVRGITSFTCPECGADLREVGIVTPKAHGRVSLPAFAIGWTLLPLLPAALIFLAALAVGPQHQTTTLKATLSTSPVSLTLHATYRTTPPYQGMSSTGSTTVVNGQTVHTNTFQLNNINPGELTALSADIATPNGHTSITFRPDRGDFEAHHAGSTTVHTHPFTAADIDAFTMPPGASASGLSPAQAQGIATGLNALADGRPLVQITGFTGGSSSGFTVNSSPSMWYVALLVAATVAIYVAGYVIYFRVRSAADAQHTPV